MNTSGSPWLQRFRLTGYLILFVAMMGIALQPVKPIHAADPVLPPELSIIPSDAAGFLTVRVDQIWQDLTFKATREMINKQAPTLIPGIENALGMKINDIERFSVIVSSFSGFRDRGPNFAFAITTSKPFDRAKVLNSMKAFSPEEIERIEEIEAIRTREEMLRFKKIAPPIKAPLPPKQSDLPNGGSGDFENQPKETSIRDLNAPVYVVKGSEVLLFFVDDRTMMIMPLMKRAEETIAAYLGQLLKRNPKGNLQSALLTANGKDPVVCGVNISSLSKVLGDNHLDLFPGKSILEANSATLRLNLDKESKLTISLDCPNEATATKIEESIKALVVLGKEMVPEFKKKLAKEEDSKELAEAISPIESLLQNANCEVQSKTVTLTTKTKPEAIFNTGLSFLVLRVQHSSAMVQMQNNFKQIALAAHNYHDANGFLPFPAIGKNGVPLQGKDKPLLSWRVAILPYIEQDNLYRQFKLDEPWDSEHNKKLIPQMPKIYAPRKGVKVEEGHTFVQVFTGPQAMMPRMSLIRIPDGTSNTIMCTESATAVPWTKPEDIPFDPKKDLPKLGASFGNQLVVAICDGSVRTIDLKKVKESTLKLLIQPNDGMVIPDDY